MNAFRILITLAAVALLLGLGMAGPAMAQGDPSLKIGLNRIALSGATYSHNDGTQIVKETGTMVGNELFVEYMLFERFGIEFGTTLTPLERVYELQGSSGAISDSVTENLSTTTVGVNLYFNKAVNKGIKYLLGLGVGTGSVEHEFSGGTLGTTSSTNDLTFNTIKFGIDWVTELAGLRAQYQYTDGRTRSTDALPGVTQAIEVSGGAAVLGVFAFF